MPRATYGPEVKRRALHLLTVLLDYAEDCLEAEEKEIDRLRPHIQVRWKADRQLVVRTKVRYLEALTKLTTQSLTIAQVKESLRRWLDYVECLEDYPPTATRSENWHFTLKLWYPRRERDRNLQQFQAIWEERRGEKAAIGIENILPIGIDNLQSCPATNDLLGWFQQALEKQDYQNLTTNTLMVAQGLMFDVAQVYVPLPLQEILPEETQEEAPTVTFETFFQNLGDRTAIIGDPGSGKTTLLQKIVAELQSQLIPVIWISLADIQTKSLTDYLLQDWLQLATGSAIVSSEAQTQLTQQFATGKIWLLLDAVDEMGIDASVALKQMARELRGWLGQAKVILTCRSAIWHSSKNPLAEFRVFQNLSLTVQATTQIVQAWFSRDARLTHDSPPSIGQRLLAEIQKSDRQWLRRSLRNPLRLAMLCQTWSLYQGSLPETRTALYRQFVETFYRWKQEAFPTTLTQRLRLNQALGHLAWQAIQQGKYRFSETFIAKHFPVIHLELLDLALQIGWLQRVTDISIGDATYSFYHATFQEYFAAQVVQDWQPLTAVRYREVFLLWLGREDIEAIQKVHILTAITDFQDNCGGFYQLQMTCLAAAGLAEFSQFERAFERADELIDRLITWKFRSCLPDKWQAYPTPIVEAATVALAETDRQRAIAAIEQFIQTTPYPYQKWTAAYSLGRSFDPGNRLAIDTIAHLLTTLDKNEQILLRLSKALQSLSPGHSIARATLEVLLQTSNSPNTRRKAAYLLAKADPGNKAAIATLEQISQTSADQSQRRYAMDNLKQLATGHSEPPRKIAKPVQNLEPPIQQLQTRQLQNMIASWERHLQSQNSYQSRERAACRLLRYNPQHTGAIKTLTELLQLDDPSISYQRIAETLQNYLSGSQLAHHAPALRQLLPTQYPYNSRQQAIFKLLWYISQIVTIDNFAG